MKKNKPKSTFEKEMLNPGFKAQFDQEYHEFVLSELLLALMEDDKVSVRQLAKAANMSPTAIQKMRSGEQKYVKIKNFIRIASQCGYNLILEKGKTRIRLGA